MGTKTLWEEQAYDLELYMLGYVIDANGLSYLGTVGGKALQSTNALDLNPTTYKSQVEE